MTSLVKTRLKSRLGEDTLDQVMHVCNHRPSDNDQEEVALETKSGQDFVDHSCNDMKCHSIRRERSKNCSLVDETFFIPEFATGSPKMDLW